MSLFKDDRTIRLCHDLKMATVTLNIFAVYKYLLRNLFNASIVWVIGEGRGEKKRIFLCN